MIVDGSRERLVLHVPGDPQRAWNEADLAAKLGRYADPALARAIIAGGVAPAGLVARVTRP